MTVTASSFRTQFPEFSNTTDYTDAFLNLQLQTASLFIDLDLWSTWADRGVSLLTAHYLTLQKKAQDEANTGNAPGLAEGPTSAQSGDKVSVNFDTTVASEDGAGWYNLTVYGQQYYRMVKMMGAAPIQLGAGPDGSVAGAWAGPWSYIWPNPS